MPVTDFLLILAFEAGALAVALGLAWLSIRLE